jgi:hypothetical protein
MYVRHYDGALRYSVSGVSEYVDLEWPTVCVILNTSTGIKRKEFCGSTSPIPTSDLWNGVQTSAVAKTGYHRMVCAVLKSAITEWSVQC